MDEYAPVLLFTYNRREHLEKTIKFLKKNKISKKTDLVIYSDGPKNLKEIKNVKKVRNLLKNINGFKSITICKRKKNFGLSKNIIKGISQTLKKYENAIILEDDLIVNENFLKYMNDGLRKYKKSKKIASIHAYIPNIKFKKNAPHYFFLRGADCWGWATWSRAWKKFNPNGVQLKKIIDRLDLKYNFNLDNSYDYYQMLENQTSKKNDSWAIRWYASAFVENMLTLYPKHSFVKNIGLDGTGTHGSGLNKNMNVILKKKRYAKIKNYDLKENLEARKCLIEYYNKTKDTFFIKTLKKIYYWFPFT
tara:strand:- start:1749 stop:2666 length:918 start_codon:yes stop_codon:yes gene_type:complete